MPLRLGSPLPSLDADSWLGQAPGPEDAKGRLLLVHFWAVSCHVCKERYPTIAEWRDRYGPSVLRVVAVHMPRQESDTDVDAVRRAAEALGMTEPCAADNTHSVKAAFGNDQGWVPAYYLFDREGLLRSRTAGETGLGMMKGTLERLAAPGQAVTEPAVSLS